MYLKLDTYFLQPNTDATIQLFNGTFERSDNVIDRDRMIDASLLGNGDRITVNDDQWTEENNITFLNFQTGNPGTWVAGVSTAPRSIEMDADAFNTYLEHEGILDMKQWRTDNNALDSAAVEKYSKHVKTIFQVGDTRTDDWQKELGYPIEFIPLENPYLLNTGDQLNFKLLFKGQPLANQLVYADYRTSAHGHHHHHDDTSAHNHNHDDADHNHDGTDESAAHTHTSGQQLRTNSEGIATANITAGGIWYLQTIHLVNTEEEGFTHESNWTTLTFEVTHRHLYDGVSWYLYLLGGILLVGLVVWFRRGR